MLKPSLENALVWIWVPPARLRGEAQHQALSLASLEPGGPHPPCFIAMNESFPVRLTLGRELNDPSVHRGGRSTRRLCC
jgi:hypothetical protein